VPLRAFLLVFIAALAHSTWNLLAKRHLIWFSSLGETILFLPLAIWTLKQSSRLSLMAALFLLATGVLHVFYTDFLQRVGDLSIVYPLARGAAPLLSFCGAILFLREHPPGWQRWGHCWFHLEFFFYQTQPRSCEAEQFRPGFFGAH
jgi:hypothetical protein